MNTDWLAQLAPEHAPAPPGWWPPAPGWWILAALLLALLCTLLVGWRHPRLRLRRAALGELRRIAAGDPDLGSCARDIQSLLRRCALTVYGADRAAKLSGSAWLEFLASRGAAGINGARGRALLAASYGAPTLAPAGTAVGGDPPGGGARGSDPRGGHPRGGHPPGDTPPDPRAEWLRDAENFVRHATARSTARALRAGPPRKRSASAPRTPRGMPSRRVKP